MSLQRPMNRSSRRGWNLLSLAVLSLAGLAVGGLTGCAKVKPYERGRLAKPDMVWDGDPHLLAGQRHATDYREGSAGGFGGGGGGCGCN